MGIVRGNVKLSTEFGGNWVESLLLMVLNQGSFNEFC